MKFELFREVALTRDFPEHQLRAGDLATLVDPAAFCAGYSCSALLGRDHCYDKR
jgi:hypothetical protein